MNRTTEFVTGLIGGIFGIGIALFLIAGGAFGSAFEAEYGNEIEGIGFMLWGGFLLLFLSVLSTVFSIPALLRKNHKLCGGINLAVGILGFFLTTVFWLIPGILMIVSGALALRSPKPGSTPSVADAATSPVHANPQSVPEKTEG